MRIAGAASRPWRGEAAGTGPSPAPSPAGRRMPTKPRLLTMSWCALVRSRLMSSCIEAVFKVLQGAWLIEPVCRGKRSSTGMSSVTQLLIV